MTTVTCIRNQRHGDVYLGALTKKGPAERFCVQTLKSYPLFLVFSQRAFLQNAFCHKSAEMVMIWDIFYSGLHVCVCLLPAYNQSSARTHLHTCTTIFFTTKRTWTFSHHTADRKFGRFWLQWLEAGEHFFRAVSLGLPVLLVLILDQPDLIE